MIKHITLFACCALTLSGCGGMQAKPLNDDAYKPFAAMWVGFPKCSYAGYITTDQAAQGMQMIRGILRNHPHDSVKMQQMVQYATAELDKAPIPKEFCNRLAIEVASKNQQDADNAAVAQARRQEYEDYNRALQSIPRPVTCNRIGTITNCW